MKFVYELLNLHLKSPNLGKIQAIAEQLDLIKTLPLVKIEMI